MVKFVLEFACRKPVGLYRNAIQSAQLGTVAAGISILP